MGSTYKKLSCYFLGGMSCNPKTMFKCRRSEGCIARKEICNDIKNCPDGSDELGCTGTNTTGRAKCQERLSVPTLQVGLNVRRGYLYQHYR